MPRTQVRRRRQGVVGCALPPVVAVLLATAAVVLMVAGPAQAKAATIGQVVTNLRNWIMGVLAGVATLYLTLGGLRYLMAGGDPGQVEKAKGSLKAAAIGYGLAILAPVVLTALKSIVGA